MRAWKIPLLTLTTLAFLAFSLVFILGKGVERTVLNEVFYQTVLEETDTASVISRGITREVSTTFASEYPRIEADDLAQPIQDTFDEAWAREHVNRGISNLLAWLKGERESLTLVELSDTQASLQENLDTYAEQLSKNELERLGVSPQETGRLSVHQFGGMDYLPDRITIADVVSGQSQQELDAKQARFQTYYEAFQVWPYAVFVLLAALFVLSVGIIAAARWMGVIMLIIGVIVATGSYALSGVLTGAFTEQLPPTADTAAAGDIIMHIISGFAVAAAIYGSIGLLLFVVGSFAKRFHA